MNDAKLQHESFEEEAIDVSDKNVRLHNLPLNERKMKINLKWAIWIGIILLILVTIEGGMMTVIFMMRKGMW